MQTAEAGRKIIRKRTVEELTGLSSTTIWREERAGRFPKRVQITANAVGWFQDEVATWVHQRIRGSQLSSPNPHARPSRDTVAAASSPKRIERPLKSSRPKQYQRRAAG